MDSSVVKHTHLRNMLLRLCFFSVVVIGLPFAYVVSIRGKSCELGEFCFFSSSSSSSDIVDNTFNTVVSTSSKLLSSAIVSNDDGFRNSAPLKPYKVISSNEFQATARYYSSIFQDLIAEGFLRPDSKSLCVDTQMGPEVCALKEIGVLDSIGIYKKGLKPLVVSGQGIKHPFGDKMFDFVFTGGGMVDKSNKPVELASEIGRSLKPEGFLVVHTGSNDTYSFHSLIDLFNCCKLIKSRYIDGFEPDNQPIREIIMRKESFSYPVEKKSSSGGQCSVPSHKRELIQKAEPLIAREPLKPWITLKKNIGNVKYLPSIVDIRFKQRYVYVDVGSRSYGSSIVSWFKKQYPKQNKTFDIYAIEADKHFHEQYKNKKGVTLLPYAAWVKNESLFFEINGDPGNQSEVKGGRGMGRIQPIQSAKSSASNVDEIQGFDFAEWLKSAVTEKDFVVMKMDVEGAEFDLIPRLFETGAICLIDEIFLECHYNRWQKCCPGERSPKYDKTYDQCLDLFTSLRDSGVLVHQWY